MWTKQALAHNFFTDLVWRVLYYKQRCKEAALAGIFSVPLHWVAYFQWLLLLVIALKSHESRASQ